MGGGKRERTRKEGGAPRNTGAARDAENQRKRQRRTETEGQQSKAAPAVGKESPASRRAAGRKTPRPDGQERARTGRQSGSRAREKLKGREQKGKRARGKRKKQRKTRERGGGAAGKRAGKQGAKTGGPTSGRGGSRRGGRRQKGD